MAKELQRKGSDSRVPIEGGEGLAGFFTRYKDALGYLGVAVVIIIAVGSLVTINNRTKEREASIKFQSAVTLFNKDQAVQPPGQEGDEIISENTDTSSGTMLKLNEIIDNYPGTNSGKNAQYLKAASYLNEGENDLAISEFSTFIMENPEHALTPSCLLGKATAEFNSNATENSLQTLLKIQKEYPQFILKDVLDYEIAKRYLKLENWEKARTGFQTLIDNYPDSPWKNLSQTQLDQLETKHPSPDQDTEEVS